MEKTIKTIEDIIKEIKKSKALVHHHIYQEKQTDYSGLDDPFIDNFCKKKQIKLYNHQAVAIKKAIEKNHVCLATPTSSGKTLSYHMPILKTLSEDRSAKALFIYPLKALAQDQKLKLRENLELISPFLSCEIYDGDTNQGKRLKIKRDIPSCIITNPDMLHFSLLPSHNQWEFFFSNLKYVVIDEVHAYKGVFGSHVSWIFRRLDRVLKYYDAEPTYITTSATVGNPEEFLKKLLNKDFFVVKESGAYQPERHFFILNPEENHSAYHLATSLLIRCVKKGLRTIVFTKARKVTELIYNFFCNGLPSMKDKVSSYRSGYLPEERREIENRLFNGELLGVISTSALELGLDIGNLDVCILVGYPGSMINTFQRSGRVGRGKNPAAIFMIAQNDALDQFYVNNPSDFFNRGYEEIILDPDNPFIAQKHLACAAFELPLRKDEVLDLEELIFKMVERGKFFESDDGNFFFPVDRRPYMKVNIRDTGDSYAIYDEKTEKLLGTISGARVFSECHEGAIYLHRAQSFFVSKLDIVKKKVYIREDNDRYYTRPYIFKDTEILKIEKSKEVLGFLVEYGNFKVTERVVGYERKDVVNQNVLSREELDLPPYVFETTGFVIRIPDAYLKEVEKKGFHLMGSLHATEHALIGLMPALIFCDRSDIGGICYPYHWQLKGAGIFIYDGYEGGIGLTGKCFDNFEKLLNITLEHVSNCRCDFGCPSCIHSPKCGSQNHPLDKDGSVCLMNHLKNGKYNIDTTDKLLIQPEEDRVSQVLKSNTSNIIFFDLETKRLSKDVGGWHNAHLMGMSVAVIYDSVSNKYEYYEERDVKNLLLKLDSADMVVGYNVIDFDYKVLSAYAGKKLNFNTYDLLKEIFKSTNVRISLKDIAKVNLGDQKLADGVQAVQWYKDGDMEKLKTYCQKDVELVRDLYNLLIKQGFLLCQLNGNTVKIKPMIKKS